MPKKSLTPCLLQGSQTFFCELNTFIPHNWVNLNERVQARTQCCPKRFIDTKNMRLLRTTTPSKLFWAPFIPLQLALAEV